MTSSQESVYWKTNKAWYFVNDKGNYELRKDAPERAKKSFELFMSRK